MDRVTIGNEYKKDDKMTDDSRVSYDFLSPRKIVFGWGRRSELGRLARTLGRRAFIICGSRTLVGNGTLDEISTLLKAESVEAIDIATISHEPEVDDVDRIAAEVRSSGVGRGDFLIALGGGAAIDLAKAVAAMATDRQSDTVKDYLENVGKNLTIVEPPLATLAMPTTAGTGTEATKNAVISCYDPPFKKSLRDERLLPAIALVDPELTVSAPPEITAASGMDAITQLIESYISLKTQPIPRALAMQGLMMAVPNIVLAVQHGSSRPAREKMAHAALLSGMCLANSGLGLAHGVAPALGVHCGVPHGVACALMLPVALRVNRRVRQTELALLGRMVLGLQRSTPADDAEVVDAFIDRIDSLCRQVGVPRRLCEVGVTREQIPTIAAASRGSSMSGNPRQLSDEELAAELENIL